MVLGCLALIGVATSCGTQGSRATSSPTVRHGYHGPLYVTPQSAKTAPVARRYGAAGLALQCRSDAGIRGGVYDAPRYEGAAASNPQQALEYGKGEGAYVGAMSGYRLVRQTDARALFVYTVDGRVKESVVVHDGPTVGDHGWHVESWARCDWSEFDDLVPSGYGIDVWTDDSGERVSTTKVKSFPNACDSDGMTELVLGSRTYLGNPPADLRAYVAERPRYHLRLPEGAVDTGYSLDGDHLWVSADRARAYVGTRDDVELWPRMAKELVCG